MATLSGSSQTNTAGNRTWRVSLDYSTSSSDTTTTLTTSLYGELITNGNWTNVYFTNRGVSSTGYTIYSASTQITLAWSAKGRKLITTPTTKPTYNRECTDQVKTVTASLKHKESGKTSSGSANFTVPHRTLYTVTYNANGGTLGANTVTSCTHCGGNHKSYGYNATLSSVIPTRPHFTFVGWNTAADGTGTSYAAGGTYSANAAVTLYAQWQPTIYVKKNNTWVAVTQVFIKENGAWKTVSKIWSKVNGNWKTKT
jgi:uncharacterized repeat protein (TIGR02543 family)